MRANAATHAAPKGGPKSGQGAAAASCRRRGWKEAAAAYGPRGQPRMAAKPALAAWRRRLASVP